MKLLCHDEAEHAITQEFEPLIGFARLAPGLEHAGVSQGLVQQRAIGEDVADPLFKLGKAFGVGAHAINAAT